MLFAPGLRIVLLQRPSHPLIVIEDVDGVIAVGSRRLVAGRAALGILVADVGPTFQEQALHQVSKLATVRTVGEVVPVAWDNFDGPQIMGCTPGLHGLSNVNTSPDAAEAPA